MLLLSALLAALTGLFQARLGVESTQKFPPPLPSEEERALFETYVATGDEDARQSLILHNLRLVSHLVRKYYSVGKNQEDLLSIGSIGLVKAVDTFRPATGTRFATYAARCIQNEILMYFRSQKKRNAEVSLNETIDVDRDGNPLTYLDVISSDVSLTDEVERKINSQRAMELLDRLLTPRERQILILRYGLHGATPHTQREVAMQLGISRSYVSRIEKAALETLCAAMNGRPIPARQ